MNAVKAAVLVIGGMCIGAGVTTLVLKKKYAAYAEEEITSVRESYRKRISDLEWLLEGKEEENFVPEEKPKVKAEVPLERVVPSTETLKKAYNKINPNPETVEGLKETVEHLGYSRKEEIVEDKLPEASDEASTGYKYLNEDKDINVPYIISVEAYMDNEEAMDQMTLTYYAKDKVLANDAEEVIEDVRGTVGLDNLNKFGEESGNPDTVYIRNERRQAEYEVLRDPSSYSETVLGIDTWDDSPEPREPIKKFR